MQGLTHRWVQRDGSELPGREAAVPPQDQLVSRILAARSVVGAEAVRDFCKPRLRNVHPPELLPGVQAAAEHLLQAIEQRRRIVIYGDYDVDGITGTAILYHILRAIDPQAEVRTFIPHRLDDGYGLNSDSLRQLRAEGADLVVSVDCGVGAVGPARAAREVGLDLIITDHHNPPADQDALPDAVAVVHPGLPGSTYPFRDLCGAGVAFKLAWHLATCHAGSARVSDSMRSTLLSLLPLVALGTIADVVPLVGENRILASVGLQLISETPFIGLRALIEEVGLAGRDVDCEKVGFIIAPHLNACGRMDHASSAVRLLIDTDEAACRTIAGELVQMNRQRQQMQRQIQDEAARLAEDRGMTRPDRRVIVLSHERWHRGIVGIVCSRLTEMFCRPSILLQEDQGHCHGSARSIEGYSIALALGECGDLLETHGGHDMAAGLSLRADRYGDFVERITDHANRNIDHDRLTPMLRIDAEACVSELTNQAVRGVRELAPFGRSNPRPIVLVRGLTVAAPPRQVGSQGRHLSLRLRERGGSARWLKAIWWNGGRHADAVLRGACLDVAFEPKLDAWNGRVEVQAVIRDIRLR